jgi:Tol biopolymer transport system component
MRRGVLVGVLAAFLVGAGLMVPAEAVATKVQLIRTSGAPTSGIPLALTVRVANGLAGQKVWLEQKVGKKWKPVAKRKLGASKQVSLASALRLGAQRYRVHVFAKGNRKQAFRGFTLGVRPRVNPAPYINEAFTISGRLPVNGARPVKLQRRAGNSWTTVATKGASGAGSVAFARPGALTAATYRFLAPKKGKLKAFASPAVAAVAAQRNQLVSATPSGHDGNDNAQEASISGDGRYVVFQSWAGDLGPTDTNGLPDIYLRDLVTRKTVLISKGVGGAQSSAGSEDPEISNNGRYVVFTSSASNLVPVDGNGTFKDVFRYDRATGAMKLISHDAAGGGSTASSERPTVSADGSRIAYGSGATDLTSETDNNSSADVFLWTASTDTTVRISKPANNATNLGGGNNPRISADGKWIAFSGSSDDIAGASAATQSTFLRNVTAQTTARISPTGCSGDFSWPVGVANGGTDVVFYSSCPDVLPGDVLGEFDVYSKNMGTGVVTLVSHKLGGGFANGDAYGLMDMTPDGSRVAFSSDAADLVPGDGNGAVEDVFVWIRSTGKVALVSQARGAGGPVNGASNLPTISDSGRYVTWISQGQNMVPPGVDSDTDPDVYLRDLR